WRMRGEVQQYEAAAGHGKQGNGPADPALGLHLGVRTWADRVPVLRGRDRGLKALVRGRLNDVLDAELLLADHEAARRLRGSGLSPSRTKSESAVTLA